MPAKERCVRTTHRNRSPFCPETSSRCRAAISEIVPTRRSDLGIGQYGTGIGMTCAALTPVQGFWPIEVAESAHGSAELSVGHRQVSPQLHLNGGSVLLSGTDAVAVIDN